MAPMHQATQTAAIGLITDFTTLKKHELREATKVEDEPEKVLAAVQTVRAALEKLNEELFARELALNEQCTEMITDFEIKYGFPHHHHHHHHLPCMPATLLRCILVHSPHGWVASWHCWPCPFLPFPSHSSYVSMAAKRRDVFAALFRELETAANGYKDAVLAKVTVLLDQVKDGGTLEGLDEDTAALVAVRSLVAWDVALPQHGPQRVCVCVTLVCVLPVLLPGQGGGACTHSNIQRCPSRQTLGL